MSEGNGQCSAVLPFAQAGRFFLRPCFPGLQSAQNFLPCRLLAAVIALCTWQPAIASQASHHILQAGQLADSCAPGDFDPSYWTDSAPSMPGAALVGTAYAQRAIYQHQHPASCTAARYLVYLTCPNGIGSNIHLMGQALSHAMRLDRVLMVAEDPGHPYYDNSYCPPGTSVHDCYFEPVSSCTWADVAAAQGLAAIDWHRVQRIDLPEDNGVQTPVVGLHCNTGRDRFALPAIFSPATPCL